MSLYDPLTEEVLTSNDYGFSGPKWDDLYTNCNECGHKLYRFERYSYNRKTGLPYASQIWIRCSNSSSHEQWYVDTKRTKKKKRFWLL